MFRRRNTVADLLSRMALFAGCRRRELVRLASLLDEIRVPPGDVLMREGAPGRESFVVVSGTATVTAGGERIATIGPGSIVGEMALIDGAPRAATVTAETPMRLLSLDPRAFSTVLDEVPTVARRIRAARNERMRQRLALTRDGAGRT